MTKTIDKVDVAEARGGINGALKQAGLAMPVGEIRMVKLTLLKVDPLYQRPVKPHVVRRIKKAGFDPVLAAILVVGQRSYGDYVIDGQQRRHVMLDLGIDAWQALVIPSSGPEFEAKVFNALNTLRQPLNSKEAFRGQLAANDEHALAVRDAVAESGFRMGALMGSTRHNDPGAVHCVRFLYGFTKQHGKAQTLRGLKILHDAWVGNNDCVRESMISGMMTFLAKFDREIDDARFVRLLKEVPGGPTFVYNASQHASLKSKGRQHGTARVFVDVYNKGKKAGNRLSYDD